jgi:penicillin-binding protein 1A
MTQRSRRRLRRRGGLSGRLLFVALALAALLGVLVIGVTSWVLDVAAKTPPLSSCKQVDSDGDSTIYAADGSKLGYVSSDEAHTVVALKRIPKNLQLATVAIEDQRFYEHGGVDPDSIVRAFFKDLAAGEAVEGGSTITQQLVRNLCIAHPEKSLERKIIEGELAEKYAERHSKAEILGQYLNIASYGTVEGSTAVGVQAASRIFFSRPVWKLDLRREALLAGLPQAPTDYNPILNPSAARQRRNEVLSKMAELGFVSSSEAQVAEEEGLGLDVSQGFFSHRQPYFFDYVENKLLEKYGVNTVRQGGLKIYTTIEPRLQKLGLEAIHSALPYPTDPSAAFVSIDPRNGDIRAMVTSSRYSASQFNLAAQSHRQPGSTFKAFVLTTAIKQGIDPYTTYYVSKPLDLNLPRWGHWEVHTADEGYLGRINLEQATVASDNTVFAQLDLDVGPEHVAATAKAMGITSPLDGIPAEGIGGLRVGISPLELSDAYATLASGGIHRDPVAIERVVFPDGKVDRPELPHPKRVISEAVAYEVTRLLHDNIVEGTGTAAYTGCVGQAGKTGTTDGLTDAWFSGYQPNLETAVWVGYPQSNAIEMTDVHGIEVFGGTFPAEIWHAVYSGAELPCEEFSKPRNPIVWAPFIGRYTASSPAGGGVSAAARGREGTLPGQEAVGGYNPDAYAPGVGQQPYVPPNHPSSPSSPSPTPPSGGNAGLGGASPTGEGEGG